MFDRVLNTLLHSANLLSANPTKWSCTLQGRRDGFQSEGVMEHVLPLTIVKPEEKILNSKRSRMAKTVTF